MDRARWAEGLTEINWLCGRCQEGKLRLSPQTVQSKMTGDTAEVFNEDWFDRDDAVSRFVAIIVCDNLACTDAVAISGDLQTEHNQVDWDEYEVTTTYVVSAVTPAPLPYSLPAKTPEEVDRRLRSACQLLWSDHDAAGNKIRQAIEALLDEQHIRKAVISGTPAKRRSLTLHKRIEDFSAKKTSVGELLMAIKWIGNVGSHAGHSLTRDDILDALEIMEEVLDELYVKRRASLLSKAKKIIKAKGPLPRQKL